MGGGMVQELENMRVERDVARIRGDELAAERDDLAAKLAAAEAERERYRGVALDMSRAVQALHRVVGLQLDVSRTLLVPAGHPNVGGPLDGAL